MVFIGEESSKRRVNAYIYLNTFPWPTTLCFYGYRNVTRSKVTGKFLLNALHAFHRFNRHYHVKIKISRWKAQINTQKFNIYVLTITDVFLNQKKINLCEDVSFIPSISPYFLFHPLVAITQNCHMAPSSLHVHLH